MNIDIPAEWGKILAAEREKDYYKQLEKAIEVEMRTSKIFPPADKIMRALELTPPDKVKVVIMGQDPYFSEGQANGLAFAVNESVPLPPSLVNIFIELERDIGKVVPRSGTLLGWAEQGVLLLNSSLTVKEGEPMSHANLNWHYFTNEICKYLGAQQRPIVFILWGKKSQDKTSLIDKRHLVLTSAHPSPLSAYRGFFGCSHFSKANEFLVQNGQEPIDWLKIKSVNLPKKGEIIRVP